jgi:hypothetical protein
MAVVSIPAESRQIVAARKDGARAAIGSPGDADASLLWGSDARFVDVDVDDPHGGSAAPHRLDARIL